MTKSGVKLCSTAFAALLSLGGCSSSTSSSSKTIPTATAKIYFQSSGTLSFSLTDGNTTLTTKELDFVQQTPTQFPLFLEPSLDASTPLEVSIELNNKSYEFNTTKGFLEENQLIISELSLMQLEYDTSYMPNSFAQKVLRQSINDDALIDQNDLLLLDPTDIIYLSHPKLISSFNLHAIMDSFMRGEDILSRFEEDNDNDTVLLFDEILQGSSDYNTDSDGDTLSDSDEFHIHHSALDKNDTDFDGLSDVEELAGSTSPILADSDGDFLSDALELHQGSDPLDDDENGNGQKDGLENDPLLHLQWHLQSNGDVVANTNNIATIVGNDLDILTLHAKINTLLSKPKIQVIDTGIEANHEDLDVDLTLSSNVINHSNDPTAVSVPNTRDKNSPMEVGHGSAVAGILAAKTQNGLGVRGVVPGASIVGSNWLESGEMDQLESLWYTSDAAKNSTISNNSWGGYYVADDLFEQILELATTNLRDGKGRVFVVAGGNEREEFGNSNLSYLANNPYVFAVTALNHENRYAFYASPGANLLVSAYGGEKYFDAPTIATTLLMGKSYYASELGGVKGALTDDADSERNYTVAMNGTSAATPMVSGILALTLDACPDLSWRDLKYLVATTANKVDEHDSAWVKNKAGYWHSNNYGFGLIDANEMIHTCQNGYFKPLAPIQSVQSEKLSLNTLIPDNNTTVSFSLPIDKDVTIEWVGLELQSDHPYSGDLNIDLISPSGTKSAIMISNDVQFDGYIDGFKFSSLTFLGESSQGVWRVEIRDAHPNDEGRLNALQLRIKGH